MELSAAYRCSMNWPGWREGFGRLELWPDGLLVVGGRRPEHVAPVSEYDEDWRLWVLRPEDTVVFTRWSASEGGIVGRTSAFAIRPHSERRAFVRLLRPDRRRSLARHLTEHEFTIIDGEPL